MRKVYEPANAIEAHMLQDYLRQEGIGAEVQGGALTSAIGELPAAGLVRLVVPEEDYERAREALRRWEAGNETGTDSAEATAPSQEKRRSRLWVGCVAFVVGIGISHFYHRLPLQTDGVDHDYDGKLDEVWKRSLGGQVTASEVDRNFDGKFDYRTEFDENGQARVAESDDDFDGVFETKYRYALGSVSSSEVDTDGDGIADTRSQFKHGIPQSTQYINPFSGLPVRVEHYRHGVINYADIDTDKNGVMDTRNHYSADQEIRKTERISPD